MTHYRTNSTLGFGLSYLESIVKYRLEFILQIYRFSGKFYKQKELFTILNSVA